MSRFFTRITAPARIIGMAALMFAFAATLLVGSPSAFAAARSVSASAVTSSPTGKITIQVRANTPGGISGVEGAAITIQSASGTTVLTGVTDSSGTFATYVPEGTFKVKVSAKGYKQFSAEVKVAADQGAVLNANLTPAPVPSVGAFR